MTNYLIVSIPSDKDGAKLYENIIHVQSSTSEEYMLIIWREWIDLIEISTKAQNLTIVTLQTEWEM